MAGKPAVYVTRELPGDAIERLRQAANVRVWPEELPPPRDVLLREAVAAEGLLALVTDRIDTELMGAAPRLRVVSNMAVGYDNIDVAEATRRAILVTNTPGILTDTTADFAFALLMAAARRVVEADRYTRQGRWKTWGPQVLLGQDVYGACLGIVGLGGVGLAVARRARGFGMRILYHDHRRRPREERRYDLIYTELDQAPARGRFRQPARTPHQRDPPPHRRTRALPHEAHGHPGEHRPWAGGRPAGPLPVPQGEAHHRRRPGRDRGRAHPHGRPPADAGQRHHRAPHRQRQRGHPHPNGIGGGG